MRAAAAMMRLARGLWSLGWLTVLLAGIPAALVHYVGWPLPDHWPTRPDWERWVAQPLTPSAIIGTAAVLIWLLWALLVYALVVEILTRTRRVVRALRRLRLPPLPTPMQATASGVLGAAVFGMPTGTAAPPPPAVAAPPVAAQPVLVPVATAPDPAPPAAVAASAPPQPSTGNREDAAAGLLLRGGTGVALPDGGWLTDQTAAATASAAALVWLQRRRRYLPRPPAGAHRDDPDLAPLPDTVAVIEDRRHRDAAGDDQAETGDDQGPAAAVPPADPAASHPAVVGHHAGQPLQPQELPAGGVGLIGDGTLAAARGILTATLLSGDPWHPDRDAQVVTTAADLNAVLGGAADQHQATPGLTVAATLDAAMTAIEQAALARSEIAADRRSHAATAADEGRSAGTLFPPIVLLTDCPAEPADARRLAVILTLGAHLGIAGVLLGPWQQGATWQVDGDGVSHPAAQPATHGPRLCVLTAAATADLLTVLREARADRNPLDPCPAPPPPRPPRDHADPTSAAPAQRQPTAPAGATSAMSSPPAVTPPVQARLLGRPAVHRADGTAIPIRRTAALQVLLFLAVHRAGATSNQLIAALWPGPRPHAAAGRLYTPVSELRLTLQEAAGADVLVRVGDRYHLDEQHIDVDLWRLQAAVAAAAAVDRGGRADHLRSIIDGYTGELAAGRHWPWLAAPREAIRRQVIDAYVTLAAAEPDPPTALALLHDALRVDPVNDELRRLAHETRTTLDHVTPGRPR